MSQTQELSEIVCDTEVPNEEGTLSVPLFFILSPALLHPHSASHQYSRLPPSCKIGPEYKTSLDGSFMQPLIKYDVCARVDFCFTPGGPLWCVESSCPFEVATAAYVDPPIYCEDSDLHFLAQATHVVRRTPLSAPCGKVAARMAEPTPLGAAGSDGVRSTKGELEISWSSFGCTDCCSLLWSRIRSCPPSPLPSRLDGTRLPYVLKSMGRIAASYGSKRLYKSTRAAAVPALDPV